MLIGTDQIDCASCATQIARGDGVVLGDVTLEEYDLSPDALDGSVFRMLRQGQRVLFELDDKGFATQIRLGSEADMETPELLPE